ncbi:hypothetical protein ACS0TY_027888 [Phlomoides rotata]
MFFFFYQLTSQPDNAQNNHDELDFEFVGGRPYILNTNIFAADSGHREQAFKLWFDPTSNFHEYAILWNNHQIVFFVDKVPIRVYKTDGTMGVKYYPRLPMYVQASTWNATKWRGPVDWSHGPFIANFGEFEIFGCPYVASKPQICDSTRFSWNTPKYWQLDPKQQAIYKKVKKATMTYDYCKDVLAHQFPECKFD